MSLAGRQKFSARLIAGGVELLPTMFFVPV